MRLLTPLLLVSVLLLAACAGTYEDGMAAANHGDWSTAYKLLRPLADQGNAEAQETIGTSYYYGGPDFPLDYAEAAKWFRKAADQGNAQAQFQLGWMYEFGRGVKLDDLKAFKWFQKAADQRNRDAEWGLAALYQMGEGVKKDMVEACFWFSVADPNTSTCDNPNPGHKTENLTPEQLAAIKKRVQEWEKAHPDQPSRCTSNQLGLDLCGGSHIVFSSDSAAPTAEPPAK